MISSELLQILTALHGEVGRVLAHLLQNVRVLNVIGQGVGEDVVVFRLDGSLFIHSPLAGSTTWGHQFQVLPILLHLLPFFFLLVPGQFQRTLGLVLEGFLLPQVQIFEFYFFVPAFFDLMEQLVAVLIPLFSFSQSGLLVCVQVALPVLVDALVDEGFFESVSLGERTHIAVLLETLLMAQLVVVVLVVHFLVLFSFLALLHLQVELSLLALQLGPLCLLLQALLLHQGIQLPAVELLHR